MSNPVNDWKHFDVSESTFKVKALGLLEIFSMAATFYDKKMRADLKEEANDYFGDHPDQRMAFIMDARKAWPKGKALESQTMMYVGTDECQVQFAAYALSRFNKSKLPTVEDARVLFTKMSELDKLDLIKCIYAEINATIDDGLSKKKGDPDKGKVDAKKS